MKNKIADKLFVKTCLLCIIVGFLSTIFVYNSTLSLILVIIEDAILLYLALRKKISWFLVFYMIFIGFSYETSSYFPDRNASFYGFKNTNFFGLSNSLLILLVCFLRFTFTKEIIFHKHKNNSISFLVKTFLFLFISSVIAGFVCLVISDNGATFSSTYLLIYFNEIYYAFFTLMIIILVYYSFLLSNDFKLERSIYMTSIISLLVALCICPYISYIFGFKGDYGGDLMFPLSKFLIPFLILIPLYIKTKWKWLIYIAWFLGNIVSIVWFDAGTGKELLYLLVSVAAYFLIIIYRKLACKTAILIPIGFCIVLGIGIMAVLSTQDTKIGDKMNQLFSIISVWESGWLENMPSSPQIRIYEIKTIFAEFAAKPYFFLFGKGYGGSFSDIYNYFQNISESMKLSAFSLEEYELNYFYRVHETLFRIILCNGLCGIIAFCIIFFKSILKHFNVWTIIGLVWFVFYFNTTLTLSSIGIISLFIGFTFKDKNSKSFEQHNSINTENNTILELSFNASKGDISDGK